MEGQSITRVALVVNDYDEAIDFFVNKLKFDLIEDTALTAEKRWVIVKPKGDGACALVLAKAASEAQKRRVGDQTGGRVFLFLTTDDFERDYRNLLTNHIKIVRGPTVEEYGTVVVFEDLYGNLWDLIG